MDKVASVTEKAIIINQRVNMKKQGTYILFQGLST